MGGGRGHDWPLRVGEERMRLIIIRRRSQEAVGRGAHVRRMKERLQVGAPASDQLLCASSTTPPSSARAQPQTFRLLHEAAGKQQAFPADGGREGGRDKVIDSTLI